MIAVLTFGKLTHFLGKYTGEVADDNHNFNKHAVAWDGPNASIVLSKTDTEAYIPTANTLYFDSEQTTQPLYLGNPTRNHLPMNITLRVQNQDIYSTGLLAPGQGVETVETNACFEPNQYEATLIYTFYYLDGNRLKTLDTTEQTIMLVSAGSGEKYQAGVSKVKT